MTQSTESQMAAITENVRHNEKNIDLLRQDLTSFRQKMNNRFNTIDSRFNTIDAKFNTLYVLIVGTILAPFLLRLLEKYTSF